MMRGSRALLVMFGLGSIVAVLTGCAVAAGSGAPTTLWGRNLAAWLAGALVAIGVTVAHDRLTARHNGHRNRIAGLVVVTGIVLLAASLIDPGLEGVHRWIVVGPVRVNVAAMLLPVVIIGLTLIGWATGAMLVIMALLVAQPDASQATAFAFASAMILMPTPRRRFALGTVAILAALAGWAWLRPDPLAPVPEVEGIVGLAWQQSPALALASLAGLALAAGSPLLLGMMPPFRRRREAAVALGSYMLVTAMAPLVGAFPVPLIGMSMSPIIGFWLGIGALAAVSQALRSRPQ
jgi:cell division protein FtsW (lipid II flippase)